MTVLPSAHAGSKGNSRAADVVVEGMRAMGPPGVALSFTRVLSARWTGSGRNRRAVADVEMFDGLRGRIAVWRYRMHEWDAWAHQWLVLDGGDISFEDGGWRRATDSPAGAPVLAVDPVSAIARTDSWSTPNAFAVAVPPAPEDDDR